MNRRIVGVALAVLLAAIGTLGIVRYVRAADERALAGQRTAPTLVVRGPVAQGSPAASLRNRVEIAEVPVAVRANRAVADLTELEGTVALVDLVPGEQVVATRFGAPETLAERIGVEVPEGTHLVTLKLAAERAVGGEVEAGDLVAVTATFDPFAGNGADGNDTPNATHMLLHKVLVTRVVGAAAERSGGQAAADQDGQAAAPATPQKDYFVTLALRPGAVEQVVFAAEEGRVWLSIEPEDAPEDGTSVRTRVDILEGDAGDE